MNKNTHMLNNETFRNMGDLIRETNYITEHVQIEIKRDKKKKEESYTTITGVKYSHCIFEPNAYHNIVFDHCIFECCIFKGASTRSDILVVPLGFENITFNSCSFLLCDFGYGESLLMDKIHFWCSIFRQCQALNIRITNCTGEHSEFYQCRIKILSSDDIRNINFLKSEFRNCVITVDEYSSSEALKTRNIKMPYLPYACPENGEFIAWKIAVKYDKRFLTRVPVIIKLRIPADALRSSAPGLTKCRASKAEVLSIESLDGSHKYRKGTKASSWNSREFTYKVGDTVKSCKYASIEEYFDPCRYKECAEGIHFFMNRNEAIAYGIFQGIVRRT